MHFEQDNSPDGWIKWIAHWPNRPHDRKSANPVLFSRAILFQDVLLPLDFSDFLNELVPPPLVVSSLLHRPLHFSFFPAQLIVLIAFFRLPVVPSPIEFLIAGQ